MVMLIFLCGVSVNKISPCGVAVISNPVVCDICVFKPTVFGEKKSEDDVGTSDESGNYLQGEI